MLIGCEVLPDSGANQEQSGQQGENPGETSSRIKVTLPDWSVTKAYSRDDLTTPEMSNGEKVAVVDEAGERIAAEAGEHFGYMAGSNSRFTAGGFVSSDEYSGAYQEATNKVLTKAVHS